MPLGLAPDFIHREVPKRALHRKAAPSELDCSRLLHRSLSLVRVGGTSTPPRTTCNVADVREPARREITVGKLAVQTELLRLTLSQIRLGCHVELHGQAAQRIHPQHTPTRSALRSTRATNSSSSRNG